jgi:hypothetical protein
VFGFAVAFLIGCSTCACACACDFSYTPGSRLMAAWLLVVTCHHWLSMQLRVFQTLGMVPSPLKPNLIMCYHSDGCVAVVGFPSPPEKYRIVDVYKGSTACTRLRNANVLSLFGVPWERYPKLCCAGRV